MCGIVGLIDFKNSTINPEVIKEAANILAKRGPDNLGFWTEQNVGLGHRRLSILDLSPAGNQPMISNDGRYVIVYNGEIYNFQELRTDLDSNPHNWRSNCDTEVIIKSYEKWGVDCLKRFHGMFALAIWDRHNKTLFAARDRMGVKPFYYHYSSHCFAFGSRPKVLPFIANNISKEIDEQALRFYLEMGYIPAPYHIYKDIKKLPPAHYLILRGDKIHIQRYWDFRQIRPEDSWQKRKEEDLVDELDYIVSKCVKYRMISDVPIGAFLSGGLDSSVVVALMKKYANDSVKTFTIGFTENKYDEAIYANNVAKHLGTEHYCEYMKMEDLLSLLPAFFEEYDEPLSDNSTFPTMAVSKMTRKHVKVSLSGDGGDELFGGYDYYQLAEIINPFLGAPKIFKNIIGSFIGIVPRHRLKLLASVLQKPNDVTSFAFMRSIGKDFGDVIFPEITMRTKSIYDLFSETAQIFPSNLHVSEKAMRLDATHTLPDDYLQKVDIASMAFSLEARDPLLDQELVEWSMKLPVRWKIRGLHKKYLLKKLAYRYIPPKILDRPKHGFEVPIDLWLRNQLRDWAEEQFNNKKLFDNLPLDSSKIIELWKLHKSGSRKAHSLLWAIIVLLNFMEKSKNS